jgi:pantoate kinase
LAGWEGARVGRGKKNIQQPRTLLYSSPVADSVYMHVGQIWYAGKCHIVFDDMYIYFTCLLQRINVVRVLTSVQSETRKHVQERAVDELSRNPHQNLAAMQALNVFSVGYSHVKDRLGRNLKQVGDAPELRSVSKELRAVNEAVKSLENEGDSDDEWEDEVLHIVSVAGTVSQWVIG